jgi:hypothetical protein
MTRRAAPFSSELVATNVHIRGSSSQVMPEIRNAQRLSWCLANLQILSGEQSKHMVDRTTISSPGTHILEAQIESETCFTLQRDGILSRCETLADDHNSCEGLDCLSFASVIFLQMVSLPQSVLWRCAVYREQRSAFSVSSA